jgi:pimeloyl-ACP methyl ester carboxylesterase
MNMYHIESLLSARLFLAPQLVGDRIFFISNLSGRLSLYAMNFGGSIPEPLLPPDVAMQNPHLVGGRSYYVFPKLGKILVMLDKDGDENYQPMVIPIDGGFPIPAFNNFFINDRVHLGICDPDANIAYLSAESRQSPLNVSYQGDLASNTLVRMAESTYGAYVDCCSPDHRRAILIDGYSVGDNVLYLWQKDVPGRSLVYGKPLGARKPNEEVPLNGIFSSHFTTSNNGLLFVTSIHNDQFGLGYFELTNSQAVKPVLITGIAHRGVGELTNCVHLQNDWYLLEYNIDGCSWLYEGRFDESQLVMKLEHVITGSGNISNGVLEAYEYDKHGDRFILTFSTATSPTQIYTIGGNDRSQVTMHTRERVLGIPDELFSTGEDASFISFDGTRISARLYLPAPHLGFTGKLPVVYYIHGGPQSQERPDFAWFSMPLIQFLTLNGFAVFVPNVRGSTGYGMSYTKQVDRDWGGKDRLDHIHAIKVLSADSRLDINRVGVVGRSYGGYMTLSLAARHPEYWKAAVDMFGPYDLLTFLDRIPETWKPYFILALGDPARDKDFLVERSPRTYMEQIRCPLLVIQGKNDPRVIEQESHDVVEYLRSIGKTVDYLVFENEGHDVLKHENRVTCYNAITEHFKKYL